MAYRGLNSNSNRGSSNQHNRHPFNSNNPGSSNFNNNRGSSTYNNRSTHQFNQRSFSNPNNRGLLPTPQNFTSFNHSPQKARCQICNRTNHLAANCRYRYDRPNDASAHIASFPTSNSDFSTWFPDTSATHHVTPDIANLSIANSYIGPDQLKVGNGNGLSITHVGSSSFSSSTGSFHLSNILHVPDITKQLLSVHQFSKDNNCYFEFHPSFFVVKDQITGKPLLHGLNESGLYKLSKLPYQIINGNSLPSFPPKDLQPCTACCLGKLSKFSLPP
ncbi:unnamed protein product, partial [Prunus brigantina]